MPHTVNVTTHQPRCPVNVTDHCSLLSQSPLVIHHCNDWHRCYHCNRTVATCTTVITLPHLLPLSPHCHHLYQCYHFTTSVTTVTLPPLGTWMHSVPWLISAFWFVLFGILNTNCIRIRSFSNALSATAKERKVHEAAPRKEENIKMKKSKKKKWNESKEMK